MNYLTLFGNLFKNFRNTPKIRQRVRPKVAVAEGELYVSLNNGLSLETKLKVLGLVKETVRITEDEIESSIQTLTNTSIAEADVCSEENFKPVHGTLTPRSWLSRDTLRSQRFAFCRRRRRRMHAKITGGMNARLDLKVDVKGRVEYELGNFPILSAGLTGLSIPNVRNCDHFITSKSLDLTIICFLDFLLCFRSSQSDRKYGWSLVQLSPLKAQPVQLSELI